MESVTQEMTMSQAVEAMKQGKKVTHRCFMDEEHMYMKNGEIYSEDGVCHGELFFKLRTAEHWQSGWSIFGE